MIPRDKEREAVERYRQGEPVERVYRWIWPGGNPAVSYQTLQTILRVSVESDEEPPGDELPSDLDGAIRDLEDARASLMASIRDPDPSADRNPLAACDPGLYSALARLVAVHVTASKHRVELQRHRVWMRKHGGARRLPHSVQ